MREGTGAEGDWWAAEKASGAVATVTDVGRRPWNERNVSENTPGFQVTWPVSPWAGLCCREAETLWALVCHLQHLPQQSSCPETYLPTTAPGAAEPDACDRDRALAQRSEEATPEGRSRGPRRGPCGEGNFPNKLRTQTSPQRPAGGGRRPLSQLLSAHAGHQLPSVRILRGPPAGARG